MGRRDGAQVILEVVARCREILPSLVVSYEPNWMTRGNGTSPNYEFGTVHHTASVSSLERPFPTQGILRDGRTGLPGPLCNFAGPACSLQAPRLHVMSANPANHAGASRESGPVPALSLFNPHTLGLEIDYAGSAPMLAGQLLVAHVWARAVADVLAGGNLEVIRAHAETSITGKWDPGYASGKTINMAAFRQQALNIVNTLNIIEPTKEKDMPPLLLKVAGTSGPITVAYDDDYYDTNNINRVNLLAKVYDLVVIDTSKEGKQELLNDIVERRSRKNAITALAVAQATPGATVDIDALANKLAPALSDIVVPALVKANEEVDGELTAEDVEGVLRSVLGSLGAPK